jgi:hypothetical protein
MIIAAGRVERARRGGFTRSGEETGILKKLKSIVAAAIFVGALGVAVPSNLRAQAPWDCYFDGQCE